MMNCETCGKQIRHDPKYGDMDKVKNFMLCSLRPNQKMAKNSKPKWCPYVEK